MPAPTQTEATDDADEFVLDVEVDAEPGNETAEGCPGNTDDGCDPTCASACASE